MNFRPLVDHETGVAEPPDRVDHRTPIEAGRRHDTIFATIKGVSAVESERRLSKRGHPRILPSLDCTAEFCDSLKRWRAVERRNRAESCKASK